MKEKVNKTNVARLLDKAKVKYELIPYEVDENDLSAVHVAERPWCFMARSRDILSASSPVSMK